MVVLEIVFLLVLSLGALLYFAREALVSEAKMDAQQQLDATVQHVDNVLLSVEQTAGNIYYELQQHIGEPEQMINFSRHVVQCNPYIEGCAIAFKPNYYPGHEQFLAFVHRGDLTTGELIQSTDAVRHPYLERRWYKETLEQCRPAWKDPRRNDVLDLVPVITFCLPITDKSGECVGAMAVGVSINMLTKFVLSTKPSTNSYTVLVAQDGTYIMHPDPERLKGTKVLDLPDVAASPSATAAVEAMVSGETGDTSFEINGQTMYLFYKPFVRTDFPGRSKERPKWNIAIVHPKADIFSEYNHHVIHVLWISLVGLLIFYFGCRIAIRRLLSPLSMLTESAKSIAQGNFSLLIPDTGRNDEIGTFQKNFQRMQQTLEADIEEQKKLTDTLHEQREKLRQAYAKIQEGDQVQTTFLHNVTNRMLPHATTIMEHAMVLCDNYPNIEQEQAKDHVDEIHKQGDIILNLLSKKFDPSYSENRKEATHE